MTVELLRVAARDNGVAVLRYEPRRPRGVTLVAGHGYSSSKHNLDALCGFLAGHGFRVYSLDFPGHKLGASGGVLRGIDDCIDAMSAVIASAFAYEHTPVYTLGHSMGAMTAILAAASDERIAGTVAIATGYGRPSALSTLRAAGATDFRSSYVDGVDLVSLAEGVDGWYDRLLPKLAGRDALYVAATRDGMVSTASVRELFERAPGAKTFAVIESDHTYAGENARGEVLQWLNERHPRG
jgi:alpha-beta hydrolase superfamily lysophospholipase